MTKAITRSDIANKGLTLDESVVAEIERLRAEGELGDGYKTVPQCYVCCEVESRELVNKLIAAGLTNREIAESCAGINSRRSLDKDKREIAARNIWYHRKNHFNVDEPALALYRDILERRAEEQQKDHLNGIGHAVTPYAVLETVMTKGYSLVTDPLVPITIKETMDAATKLHELTNRDAGQRQMAEVLATMNRIISAAQKFMDPTKYEDFVREVEGRGPMQVLTERIEDQATQAVKEFVMPTKVDERDEM
jgi:hypothetical protein